MPNIFEVKGCKIVKEDNKYFAIRKFEISKEQRDFLVDQINNQKNDIINNNLLSDEYKDDLLFRLDNELSNIDD